MCKVENPKRFIAAAIAVVVFTLGYDWFVNTQLLMDTYLQTPQLWREVADMQSKGPWMLAHQIAISVLVSFIFIQNYEAKGISEGVRFGLIIGLLLGLVNSITYAWMPISMELALSWLASSIVHGLGAGVLLALIYRR